MQVLLGLGRGDLLLGVDALQVSISWLQTAEQKWNKKDPSCMVGTSSSTSSSSKSKSTAWGAL
jgi:hypothetical protein